MKKEDKKDFIEGIIKRLSSIDYISPDDIPDIPLYMDQVTTFMDEHLHSLKRYEGDKMLTKTMINNYSKNKLLPSPEGKKYGKDHMLLLIFIYYFKNVISIRDIASVLTPLTEQFFGKKEGELSLEDIYEEIFTLSNEVTEDITKSVFRQFRHAKSRFSEEKDEEKRKFLTDFAFLASLCVDSYIKKTVVESMIDRGVFDFSSMKEGKRSHEKGDHKRR